MSRLGKDVFYRLPSHVFPLFEERRRSARGRFFREPPQWRNWNLGALSPDQPIPNDVAGRICTEKPPTPQPSA